jgi:hypothetical protein
MRKIIGVIILALLAFPVATAQEGSQKTLAATMDVFVFPAEGQDSSQQSKDEAECYNWAVGNTGTDPFDLAKQAQAQQDQAAAATAQVDQSGKGAGAKGAVGGAAAGALIGGIVSDDPGKGAAYGAAAGAIGARRGARRAKSNAKEDIEQQSQQAAAATGEQLTNFKKAFSVCLEAKDYMVKF